MSEYFSRLSVPCRTVLCLWENAASLYLPVHVHELGAARFVISLFTRPKGGRADPLRSSTPSIDPSRLRLRVPRHEVLCVLTSVLAWPLT